MGSDNILTIIDQPVLSDGLVDDFQVVVSYARADNLTPVNPDFFDDIVAPTVDANDKLVFFQLTQDFDNLQRYLLIEAGIVNSDYPTLAAIQAVQSQFVTGQVFYAYNPNNVTNIDYSAGTFYVLGVDSSGQSCLDCEHKIIWPDWPTRFIFPIQTQQSFDQPY
jgi:hypothetical protein